MALCPVTSSLDACVIPTGLIGAGLVTPVFRFLSCSSSDWGGIADLCLKLGWRWGISSIDRYLYNGESIEEASSAELVDRGIDQEVTIIQVKKGKTRLIYKVRNESEEEWGEFLA